MKKKYLMPLSKERYVLYEDNFLVSLGQGSGGENLDDPNDYDWDWDNN